MARMECRICGGSSFKWKGRLPATNYICINCGAKNSHTCEFEMVEDPTDSPFRIPPEKGPCIWCGKEAT